MSTRQITQEEIDAAQLDLDDVIAIAKSQGLTFRTSRAWADQLAHVTTLRNLRTRQIKNARTDSGWGGQPRPSLHSV